MKAGILIYKSNIESSIQLNYVQCLFQSISEITSWTVDMEDVDNVLRIAVSDNSCEQLIRKSLERIRIFCEELPD